MLKVACGNGFPLNIPSEIPEGGGGSGETTASKVSYNNETSGLTALNVQAAIDEMVANFGDGVDEVYDACVDAGSTPASKSPADIATAIENITGGGVTMYLDNGQVASSAGEYVTANFTETIAANTTILISLQDGSEVVNAIHKYTGSSDSFDIGGYQVTMTATNIGLTYYSGDWRNMYMKVSLVDPSQIY